jgi:hypothetical protein
LLNSDKINKELSKQLLDSNYQLNETIRKSNEIIISLENKVVNNQIVVEGKLKSIEDELTKLKDTTSNINNNIILGNKDIL